MRAQAKAAAAAARERARPGLTGCTHSHMRKSDLNLDLAGLVERLACVSRSAELRTLSRRAGKLRFGGSEKVTQIPAALRPAMQSHARLVRV